MFKKINLAFLTFLLSFSLIYAESAAEKTFQSGINNFVHKINTIFLEPILTVLVTISIIYFAWGVVLFLKDSESADKEKGKSHMFWGVVGLFIIFTVWGFMNIILDTVNSIK